MAQDARQTSQATRARLHDGMAHSRIPARICVDAASALIAAATVAPAVSIIDRAVTESVSGKASLLASARSSLSTLATRPHLFLTSKPFGIMLLLYGSTYLSANVVDTVQAALRDAPASSTTAGLPKFLATSGTNLGLSLFKDIQYAKMFGVARPAAFPPASYAIFIVRDCMTISASFNLPPMMQQYIPSTFDRLITKATLAQLATPMLMQIFGAPLHLWGLDLYNHRRPTSALDRWRRIQSAWPRTALARMCRVLPAFGIAGVVNGKARRRLMDTMIDTP